MTILIRQASVITNTGVTFDPGYVAIADDVITAVGPIEDAPPAAAFDTVIDAPNCALVPGLVNAHTHLSQTFMRGMGDDKPLFEWLQRAVWPLQAAMTPEDVYLATLLGLVENLSCGVTALTEHHKITTTPAHTDAVLRAAEQIGLRFTLAYGWVDLGNNAQAPTAIVSELTRLYAHYRDHARITIALGPMAPWRCSDALMQETFALAEAWDVPFHLHTAETRAEVDLMIARNGLRHVDWLNSLGLLAPRTQLVHGVWLSDGERALIRHSGAQIVHCATSNMYLASGIAPIAALHAAGVPIALGADGSGSNNSQDMLELLKITALLSKIGSMDDPGAAHLRPLDIIGMATVHGTIGSGTQADLTIIDLDTPRAQPVYDAASAVVYNASGADVQTVIVGGRLLLHNKQIIGIDVAALMAECRGAARALWKRALS